MSRTKNSIKKPDCARGWVVASAGCLINAWTFGIFYSFATAVGQMVEEFDASLSGVAALMAVTTFLFFALGIVTGPLADKFGARRLITIGALFMGGGLWFTAQAQSLLVGTITYSLGVGLGIGSYLVPMSVATGAWFVKHRTLALGVNTAGIGLGTLFLVPVCERLITSYGWRHAFEIMGIGSIAIYLVCALLSFRPPTPPSPVSASVAAVKSAVKRLVFWRLYFSGLSMSLALFVPFVFLVQYAKEQGISSSTAAFLITSLGLGSVLGRLGLGILGLRVGVLPLVVLCFCVQPVAYTIWLLAGGNYILLLAFAALLGVGYGGYVALSPVAAAGIFGLQGLGGVLGVLYTSAGIGALIGPIAAGAVIDATGSYTIAIVASIVVSTLAVGIALPLWKLGNGNAQAVDKKPFPVATYAQPSVFSITYK